MELTPEQFVEAVKQVSEQLGLKHDPASTVSNWTYAHGPGGLFNAGTVRPGMYSTLAQPQGLERTIPLVANPYVNEVYEILTGQTVTEGTRAADICSEGPFAGKLKVCRQVIGYGTMKIDTSVERLTNFGRRLNYADVDRDFFNLMSVDNPLIPDILNSQNINTDVGKMIFEAATAIGRSYAMVDVHGVQGATTAPGGVVNTSDFLIWISQYDGLSRWIRTGYQDTSGVACQATDSVVVTHNAAISSNGTNGQSFIANVVNAYRSVQMRAQRVGMGGTQWAIVMHPNAAWAVFDNWACNYNTDRCTGSAGNPVFQTANDVVQFRDALRNGMYLLIDGKNVPIIFSDGMEWNGISSATFKTDIFIVPLTYGGRPLLYRQYFPLNNPVANDWVGLQPPLTQPRVINNGLYAVGARTTNGFCTKLEFISQTRLILDAPFLAARIDDVQVTYNVSSFDPFVGMSDYRDGGQSSRFTTPTS